MEANQIIKRNFIVAAAAITAVTYAATPASADDVEKFYKGNQIKIIVSTGPAGGYNNNARTLARHMGKYIPGNPKFIVQNMPGAGGLKATNHIYNKSPKDGTVLGVVMHSMTTASTYGLKGARFDSTKFNWIGSISGEPNFLVTWHKAKVKNAKDLLSSKKELIVGGNGAGSGFEIVPRVLNAFFGTNIKVISGYNFPGVVLAMEQGETDGIAGYAVSNVRNQRPDWLSKDKVNLVVTLANRQHPDFKNVPLISDFAKNDDQKKALSLIFASLEFIRNVLAPPGIPEERVAVLRKAFWSTMQDGDFLAEMKKRRLPVAPKNAHDLTAAIKKIGGMSPRVVEMAKNAMFPPGYRDIAKKRKMKK